MQYFIYDQDCCFSSLLLAAQWQWEWSVLIHKRKKSSNLYSVRISHSSRKWAPEVSYCQQPFWQCQSRGLPLRQAIPPTPALHRTLRSAELQRPALTGSKALPVLQQLALCTENLPHSLRFPYNPEHANGCWEAIPQLPNWLLKCLIFIPFCCFFLT